MREAITMSIQGNELLIVLVLIIAIIVVWLFRKNQTFSAESKPPAIESRTGNIRIWLKGSEGNKMEEWPCVEDVKWDAGYAELTFENGKKITIVLGNSVTMFIEEEE